MINKYICMGYMSSDPELKTFNSGKAKCTFSMGMNSGKETTWVDIECWDKIAANCSKILKKGSLVFIEGKLKYLSWKDKNGHSKNKIICCAEFVKAINVKNDGEKKQFISETEINEITKKSEQPSKEFQKDIEMQEDLDNIPW